MEQKKTLTTFTLFSGRQLRGRLRGLEQAERPGLQAGDELDDSANFAATSGEQKRIPSPDFGRGVRQPAHAAQAGGRQRGRLRRLQADGGRQEGAAEVPALLPMSRLQEEVTDLDSLSL